MAKADSSKPVPNASDSQVRALLSNAKSMNLLIGADGVVRYSSTGSLSVLGMQPDEIVGKSLVDLVIEEDRPARQEMLNEVLADASKVVSKRIRLKDKSGKLRTAECTMRNELSDPEVGSIVCNCRDLTEFAIEHDELTDAKVSFRALLDSSQDAIGSFDRSRRIVTFNRSFATIMRQVYGIELQEGMIVPNAMPEADRAFFEDIELRVLQGDHVVTEREYPAAAGSRAIIEFRGNPLLENDRIIGGSIFARDVTEKRRNERQLQLLFDQNPLPLWVFDVETLKFLRVNRAACKMYGYTESEFLSLTALDIRAPEQIEDFLKIGVPLLRGKDDSFSRIVQHRKKSGELMSVKIDSHLISYEGKLVRMAHLEDVTDQLVAEQALVEANRRFEMASEATLSSIFEIDLATGHTIRSKGLRALLGFDPEEAEATQDWWESRIHPDDLTHAKQVLMDGIVKGVPAEAEYRIRHRDGHYITVWDRGIVVKDEEGKAIRVFGAVQDVSERVRIKRELERSNELFQLATHAVTSMIYELDLVTGVVQRTNTLTTLTGFEASEADDHSDWWFSRIHPDDVLRVRNTIERAAVDGSEVYECEYRFQHKAGHYITIWHRGVIARDAHGKAVRSVGSAQDITRRRSMEHELERANERFQLAAAAVNSVIYDWDLKTDYAHYSSGLEQLLGFVEGRDEGIHQDGWYISRVHPDDRAALRQVWQAIRYEGVQYEVEYRTKHRNGHYLYVWDRGNVIRDNAGHAVRVVGSVQDITSKKLIEAQLTEERNRALTAKESADEMNRLKSAFLASMSHEIRTPMTAVLGFAEVLRENLKDTSNARFIEIIETNSKRLLETLNGILDLARIESTRITLEHGVVNVNSEVERILTLLEPLASKKGIEYRFEAAQSANRANLDVRYLDQIVTNLVSNAIKFTSKGHVRVVIQFGEEIGRGIPESRSYFKYLSGPIPSVDHFQIIVEDTGVGIPREQVGLVFDEFRQVSGGYNRHFEGSGLGLAISSKLAHAMGGSIEVRSAHGIGSQFIVRLPVNIASMTSESGSLEAAGPAVARKPTILLVEDIASMAEMTQAMIGQRATLLHASGTADARKFLESVTPDLILMDINLGEEMTGLDFTRELKAKGLGQYARIVALTAYAMPSDRQMALDAGCDDYLAKPFSKSVLLEMIEKNLAERSKLMAAPVNKKMIA